MSTPERDLDQYLHQQYLESVREEARDRHIDTMQEWLEYSIPHMRVRFADCDDVLAALDTEDFEQVYQAINEVPDHPGCDRYWRSMMIFRNELQDLQ